MGRSKPVVLSGGAVLLGAPRTARGGILSDLASIGSGSVNFVRVFNREDELPTHLARRIAETVRKRQLLFSLLYAEQRERFSVQIGGALVQDRSGSSSSSKRDGKTWLSGSQAGHIAIGTYSIDGELFCAQALRVLRAAAGRGGGCPRLSDLVAASLACDGGTELVPAFVNQSSGKFETSAMRYMKGLTPAWIAPDQSALERQLAAEAERVIDFFVTKQRTFIAGIDQRLQAIRAGSATEYLQEPADPAWLIFGGEERRFLAAVLDELRDPGSRFRRELDGLVLQNITPDARYWAGLAQTARDELDTLAAA